MKLFKRKTTTKFPQNIPMTYSTDISEAIRLTKEDREQYHRDTFTMLYMKGWSYNA